MSPIEVLAVVVGAYLAFGVGYAIGGAVLTYRWRPSMIEAAATVLGWPWIAAVDASAALADRCGRWVILDVIEPGWAGPEPLEGDLSEAGRYLTRRGADRACRGSQIVCRWWVWRVYVEDDLALDIRLRQKNV